MRTTTLTLEDDVAALLDRARAEGARNAEMLVNRALRSALSAVVRGNRPLDSEPPPVEASKEAVPRPATFQTLVELVSRHRGVDGAFADDLERIQHDQPRLDDDPWES